MLIGPILLEEIQRHGFAILPEVFSQAETAKLLYDIGRSGLPRTRAGIRHAMRHAVIARFARDARLLGLAQSILGTDAVPTRATLFDKSPASNWLVVWHQDTALPLRAKVVTPGWGPWSLKDGITYAHAPASALERVVALRVHLDESSANNGPLRVLPGTHRLGVLSDEAIENQAARVSPVECLLPQGGVLVMRPLLVHASSKSHGTAPRRVLHIEYSLPLATPLALAVA